MIQVPNQCPFKEDILKEVEALRKHQEEEKQKRKEAARERKRAEITTNTLEGLVNQAENKQLQHESMEVRSAEHKTKSGVNKEEHSLKAYYKEFKKVVDEADVILEVVDARDPLGTQCKEVKLSRLLSVVEVCGVHNELFLAGGRGSSISKGKQKIGACTEQSRLGSSRKFRRMVKVPEK